MMTDSRALLNCAVVVVGHTACAILVCLLTVPLLGWPAGAFLANVAATTALMWVAGWAEDDGGES